MILPNYWKPKAVLNVTIALCLFGLLVFFSACNEKKSTSDQIAGSPNSRQSLVRSGLKFLDFIDPENGMLQYRSPYPSGWKLDPNPNDLLLVTGPGNTEIHGTMSGQFFYSNDPFARESASMAGKQIRQPITVDQYLGQVYKPYMEQRGFRFKSSYPLPKIQNFWELFSAGMPQGLSKRSYYIIGADWASGNGTQACTVLVMNVMQQGKYVTWNVWVGELYAPDSVFDTSKDAYLYASAMTELNPKWQISKNKELLRKISANRRIANEHMRRSQIQHLNRMNSILARGAASSSTAKINSDILDISHSGYLKRSDMVSAGQTNTVNTIGERAIIANGSTGERYQVEAGSGNYWVNGQGEYFRTDNSLYDPRTDNSLNHQEWTPFEVVQ